MPNPVRSLCASLVLVASSAAAAAAQGSPPADKVVVNEEQATRGATVYKNVCVECHENTEYTGADFRTKWNGKPVFDLWDLLRTTMPDGKPGTLTNQQYSDVVVYMMKLNGVPAGKTTLPASPDSLKKIKIEIPGNGSK